MDTEKGVFGRKWREFGLKMGNSALCPVQHDPLVLRCYCWLLGLNLGLLLLGTLRIRLKKVPRAGRGGARL